MEPTARGYAFGTSALERLSSSTILFAFTPWINIFRVNGIIDYWEWNRIVDLYNVSSTKQSNLPPAFIQLILAWFNTFSSKSLRTPSNLFIVNLAIFDLLMMLEMPMFLANSSAGRLLGYDLGCTIYAALGSVSGIGASISNAVIAFDRYK